MWETLYRLLTELSSRPGIAKLAGSFAKSPASRRLIPRFAAFYGIPLDEAEHSPEEYASLNDFFIRRLKPGARPIDSDFHSVVSPVDGTVIESGRIGADRTFSVKGQSYSMEQLLNGSPHAVRYKNGYFAVIYLSPSNYHRIHSPVTGAVIEFDRIPGKVYPVNEAGMRLMPRVLSRNTRLVTYIEHGSGTLALIKVGAMNVASIRFCLGERPPERVDKGDELAYFEFGSTVVLLWENGTFIPGSNCNAGSIVKMGERIGEMTEPRG
jgi:phosphatidylserine decarboxylase